MLDEDNIICEIVDNGIGRKAAAKFVHQMETICTKCSKLLFRIHDQRSTSKVEILAF